uniref:Tyrosine transaminase n=1 Tax=Angomonas desouzai TaxID=59800 RepID=T1YTD1_9TRYP|nr:tyrosine transaminase [Angomonas desouzai]
MSFPEVKASRHADRTIQMLTELTDKMKPSSSSKSELKLSIGDPTVDGNLRVPKVLEDALVEVVRSGDYNGYPPVAGYDETRQAVAEYLSRFCQTQSRKENLKWSNTLITSGGSHAIVLSMTAIANEGDNFLICAPAFPHYQAVCDSYGYECRYYPLVAEKNWEADLEAMEKMVDSRTRALIMINPSNPCGSNWSREHVQEVIHFCERHNLPIISDEIYSELVFHGETFSSVSDFDTDVPRVILGGGAKHVVTPGWRIGWLCLVDPSGQASKYMEAMDRLSQLHTGANSVCQMAFAKALLKTPQEHLDDFVRQLEAGAKVYERIHDHDCGLTFAKPCASMFIMFKINFAHFKDINDDMEFYEKLLDEENVQMLPGSIFGMKGCVRATTSRPPAILGEAVERIVEFCDRHKK